jgi:hypothetical protein
MDIKGIIHSLIEEKLSEKVEIDHSRYMRSHGKKAKDTSDTAQWVFTSKEMGEPKDSEMVTVSGKLPAAAKEAAKKLGANRVYVMEGVNVNEEADFKVSVEGLPDMYVKGKSSSEVKANLRKVIKKPDSIQSIDRVMPSTLKKIFRDKAAGKEDIDEALAKDYSGMLGQFKKAVDKAEEAKSNGDKQKMSKHLEDARNRLFGMKSTDSAKLKTTDHYDRYNKMKGLTT